MDRPEFPRQYAVTRRFTLGTPRAFTVSPDGQRVVFLRSTSGVDEVNRLWRHDVGSDTATIVADPLELIGDAGSITTLPPEERVRRERQREVGGGIVTYATDPEVTGAVFALAGRLFTTDLLNAETARLPTVEGVVDPRPDPSGSVVAYIADGDLHVTSLDGGDQLIVGSDNPSVTYGLADFIAAEEMGRNRGYWWSDDGKRLLVARVDTSDVPEWHIASPIEPAARPRTIRYPVAGSSNATVRLEIHDLDGADLDVAWNPEGTWEYLADASWAPRPRPTLVVQTRDQKTTAVLDVDPVTGSVSELYRWTDPHWTEIVPGAPAWVGERLLTVEDRGSTRRLVLDGIAVTDDDLQIRKIAQADDHGVLALASTDATQQHLVHVDVDGNVNELTSEPGLHTATTEGDVIVISSTGMDRAGTDVRIRRDGSDVGRIEDYSAAPEAAPNLQFIRSGIDKLHTAVLFPGGVDRDSELPVLMDPYGGPHAQRVQQARGLYAVPQWFADQGYAVVIADGRGTPGRGPDFERAVWGDFAAPVLEDQLIALDSAAAEYPGLDLDRVGIRGWSFGGYLAALAVLRRPDRFHAAIAGAPVTSWALYDTHYTERYLGHPDAYPDHYTDNDLINEASRLTRPLLLIHGLADDNVVAAHTLQLSQALLAAGRPHSVLPLSGVTHMTPQEVVAENLLVLQARFFDDQLKAAE